MKKHLIPFALVFFLSAALGLHSCSKESNGEGETIIPDNFDRQAMLADWADKMIIPAYESYLEKLQLLSQAKDAFIAGPDATTLSHLRINWKEAYRSWQRVSMFEIGKAESLALRNYSNIYPTSIEKINVNVKAGNYNLDLPSNFDAQGFPALDYLLYGIGESEQEILDSLSLQTYAIYLSDVVDRLNTLTAQVVDDWKGDYRETFINNDGSSATSSVDKMVNDFLFYYEKFLRAGKIGIPAGVFSGTPNSLLVEAPYSGEFSKQLFDASFLAVQDFFNGKSLDGTTSGESLSSYLDYLNTLVEREDLSTMINNQWNVAESKAVGLKPNLKEQVEENNIKMLEVYDELQKVVVMLKVDMLQAMNIRVDFVDADGD